MPRPILNIAAKLAGRSRSMASDTQEAAPTHEHVGNDSQCPKCHNQWKTVGVCRHSELVQPAKAPSLLPSKSEIGATVLERGLSPALEWPLPRMLRSMKPSGFCE